MCNPQNLEVLCAVKNELEKQGKLAHPKVYVRSDCDDIESLKNGVRDLGGSLASSASEFGLGGHMTGF